MARQILAGVGKDGVLPELPLIEKAHAEDNWSEVERLAHKMKGGACYGTVRLYYALLYMERYKKAGHTRCLEQLYEQMINTIEETLEHLENMH